jgi:hypothetical protein
MLLAMTALTAISEAKSILADSDSVYCYTASETRRIAVLLAEGERCDSLLVLANRQLEIADSVIIKYAGLERNLSTARQQAEVLVSELAAQNKALQAENDKLRRKGQCKKRIIGGSAVVNVLLIILIAL